MTTDDSRSRKQTNRATSQASSNGQESRPSLTDQIKPPPRRPPSILEPYKERIDQLLRESEQQPPEQRYTARQIYQLIQEDGYSGSDRTVQRYVSRWWKTIRSQEA